jgi:hypothetical protein
MSLNQKENINRAPYNDGKKLLAMMIKNWRISKLENLF